MTRRTWPTFSSVRDMAGVIRVITGILDTRQEDIDDFNNLPSRFIGGRKVAKIPASSADYVPYDGNNGDLVGDVSYTVDGGGGTPYLYVLMEDGTSATWVRFQGDASW